MQTVPGHRTDPGAHIGGRTDIAGVKGDSNDGKHHSPDDTACLFFSLYIWWGSLGVLHAVEDSHLSVGALSPAVTSAALPHSRHHLMSHRNRCG